MIDMQTRELTTTNYDLYIKSFSNNTLEIVVFNRTRSGGLLIFTMSFLSLLIL
jgi:hypothetical protein